MSDQPGAAPHHHDCLIVGAGPAGLTAAIYLARFHLSVMVVDNGQSRAARIPLTRNLSGYPEGIAGVDLMARMQRQAVQFGAIVTRATVTGLERVATGFDVHTDGGVVPARSVLLATGAVNTPPPMLTPQVHDAALATGRLRYCPVCDGYEVTDRRVAVLGTGQRGCDEALFLRSYTADLTLVAPGEDHQLNARQRTALAEADIAIAGPCRAISLRDEAIMLDVGTTTLAFDSIYPALGLISRTGLATALGVDVATDGSLQVDAHQRTSIPGLYAAGDVVLGLDQISHAMGEGSVAATAIRNDLARRSPIRRRGSYPVRAPVPDPNTAGPCTPR